MLKLYKFIFFFLSVFSFQLNAQDSVSLQSATTGYYQTINLDPDVPCNCDVKTLRNEELNTRLLESDISQYDLHSYKYIFGTSMLPASKLFHAFELDTNVYKISFSMETKTFMILTKKDFDLVSFETAAKIAFLEITPINPKDFLYAKNRSCYDAYLLFLAKQNSEVK